MPLGNGKMGAMVFFKNHTVHIALNHYDCYYPILPRYAKERVCPAEPAKTYEQICGLVRGAREEPEFSRSHYAKTLHPAQKESRPAYTGTSYPVAGEIQIRLHKEMKIHDFSLRLIIETGTVVFAAKGRDQEARMKIWVAKVTDCLILQMEQSHPGLWRDAELLIPSGRGLGGYSVRTGDESHTIWMRTAFTPESELRKDCPFTAETALAAGQGYGIKRSERGLAFDGSGKELVLAASVLPGENAAIRQTQHVLGAQKQYEEEHLAAWRKFWRCTVRLPDYFLETLWHLHLYAIECASGIGSAYPEQACGLNGLWDIRRPTLWGSMWYWDVNIQEAFWPAFSSNHLELAKLFCEGYLRYEEDAEKFARDIYGVEGWALDYPHTLYYCIQPWCAQFLWRYYRYSGDLAFLENDAYRVFQKQISFFKQMARVDREGTVHMDPDISPEQGPVTRDSVITIASIKQLLGYALEAADILGRPAAEKEEFRRLLDALPGYEKTEDGHRWKDSALAPDDLFFRHPSVLMPIFPAEEISKNSPEEIRKTAWNTLKYASTHTETGVFGFGWIACAAAKMGEGASALRILYEEGLDDILHSNGLGYEESERFINYCLVTKPPLYPPAMMEPSGGIVMAVNTMLLQAEKYIEVFPAVPDGQDRLLEKKAAYKHLDACFKGQYPAWDDCRFTGLLALGGFEVSAERKAGKAQWIQVTSKRRETLRLLLPAELSPSGFETLFEKTMEPEETICFGSPGVEPKRSPPLTQARQAAFTHRRVFLGGDRHTEFYKAVDSFTCAYRLGNSHQYQMTPYIFDFGDTADVKNYDAVFHKEFYATGRSLLFFGGPKRLGAEVYQEDTGYGFAPHRGIAVKDRKAPDDLRKDFVEGRDAQEFWIELPRGKYSLLLVSGDEEKESLTHVSLPSIRGQIAGKLMRAGQYQCKVIPFMHERDGIVAIAFSTEKGYKWKINAIFVNKEYAIC